MADTHLPNAFDLFVFGPYFALKAVGLAFSVAVEDDKVLPLGVAQFAQATLNQSHLRIGLRGAIEKRSQTRHHPPPLTTRSNRPSGHRAAEQCDEIASFQLTELHTLLPLARRAIQHYLAALRDFNPV